MFNNILLMKQIYKKYLLPLSTPYLMVQKDTMSDLDISTDEGG